MYNDLLNCFVFCPYFQRCQLRVIFVRTLLFKYNLQIDFISFLRSFFTFLFFQVSISSSLLTILHDLQPHVDFGLKVMGADLMSIPGLYWFIQVKYLG